MSALDRLENYSAKRERELSASEQIFDTKTPEGAFLQLVHNKGYQMYDANGNFSELHKALTTNGNQRIQAIAGSGKALVNGTKIMTKNGLVPIENLRIMDEVWGEDGKLHKVVGVFPQGKKKVYEVIFNNGYLVECCSEHLWTICYNGITDTVTTEDIFNMVGNYNLTLPKVKPITFDKSKQISDYEMDTIINNIIPYEAVAHEQVIYGSVEKRLEYLDKYLKHNGNITGLSRLLKTLGKYLIYAGNGYCISDTLTITSVNSCGETYKEMTCISIDSPTKLYLVDGGIPTHNTTMMIFKIMHDIVTGEVMKYQELPNGNRVRIVDKVFVGTFLRSGAEELKKKLMQNQRAMGYTITTEGISFGTLHAEFKRCLNSMGVATPIGSPTVLNNLLRRAITACNITRNGEKLKQEDYKIIESILMYYRGRLDNKRYLHPSAHEYDLTNTMLDLLYNQYSALKIAEKVMDFEDLQELLYKHIYVTPNQNVINFVANRYNYIYLDEFQDTSQIQYEILKAYCRGFKKDSPYPTKGKIVVVGDVQQCIYSFRGSCIEVMHEMFNKDFEAVNNSLSLNYRCPSEILSPIKDSIILNLESKGIEINAKNQGGIFKSLTYANISQMLTDLEEQIYADLRDGMNIGVLCRTNYDGLLPALFLELQGKYNFSISSESMTLSTALPKRLVNVARIFTEKATPAVKDTLSMLIPYTMQWNLKKIMDVLKTNRISIWDLDEDDLKYSFCELYFAIAKIRDYRSLHGVTDIDTLKFLYTYLMNNVFDGDSQYSESARSIISVLLYFLDNKEFKTVHDFIEEMESLNERLNARIDKDSDIAVATVHEFKGKERDSIYVWNDTDGIFPTTKTDLHDYDLVSEERRVHYIACTRARKKSVIMSMVGRPSMFLAEMDCKHEAVFKNLGVRLGVNSDETLAEE